MKNWRTTLIGMAAGVGHLYANGMSIKSAILAVGMAALGAAAKDYNVSGR